MNSKKKNWFKNQGGGLNPIAQTFIEATEIIGSIEVSAINTLINDLETFVPVIWCNMAT